MYLKPLAAELRVLVCKSSGTEGLLWRILAELNMEDDINVHPPGKLNREHPLTKSIHIAFYPIAYAGQGDPQIPAERWSLKEIIKECEALVVSGKSYTHESLIGSVAAQMGSAHEDDGVEPHLIELTRTVLANHSMLIRVLGSDADLVLQLGERTLVRLEREAGLVRRRYEPILLAAPPESVHLPAHDDDFEGPPPITPLQGGVVFTITHPNPDGMQDSSDHDFGLFIFGGSLKVRPIKHPDRTLELVVEGLGQSTLTTRQSIPSTAQCSQRMAIQWDNGNVAFYLYGTIDRQQYRPVGS